MRVRIPLKLTMEKCIFCGNDNLEVIEFTGDLSGDMMYQVKCYYCGATGPKTHNYEYAIEEWNTVKRYWENE